MVGLFVLLETRAKDQFFIKIGTSLPITFNVLLLDSDRSCQWNIILLWP